MTVIKTRGMLPLALAIGASGCAAPVPIQPVAAPDSHVNRPDAVAEVKADVRVDKDVVVPTQPTGIEEPVMVPVPDSATVARLDVSTYQDFLQVAANAPRPESKAQLPTAQDLARLVPTQLTPEQAEKLLITVPHAAIQTEVPAGMPRADAPKGIKPSSLFLGGGSPFFGSFGGFRRFLPFAFGGLPYLAPFGLYGGLWRPFWPAFYPFGASIFPFYGTPVPVPVPVPVPTTYGVGPIAPPIAAPLPLGGTLPWAGGTLPLSGCPTPATVVAATGC